MVQQVTMLHSRALGFGSLAFWGTKPFRNGRSINTCGLLQVWSAYKWSSEPVCLSAAKYHFIHCVEWVGHKWGCFPHSLFFSCNFPQNAFTYDIHQNTEVVCQLRLWNLNITSPSRSIPDAKPSWPCIYRFYVCRSLNSNILCIHCMDRIFQEQAWHLQSLGPNQVCRTNTKTARSTIPAHLWLSLKTRLSMLHLPRF